MHVIADNMIITADDEKEHTEILHKVMDRAKELNIKLFLACLVFLIRKVIKFRLNSNLTHSNQTFYYLI